MLNTKRAVIIGTGSCLPKRVLTNADLERMVETSNEWIVTRTGILERHVAGPDDYTSDLAAKAAAAAIENAGLAPADIDLVIVATLTPDMYTPSVACTVQHAVGVKNTAFCFDLNAACSGFVYAVTVAAQFLQTGAYKNALVIGAETLSKVTDWKDRNTCVLFGDGAGAVVLQAQEGDYGVLTTSAGCDGGLGATALTVPGLRVTPEEAAKREGREIHTIRMLGTEVFRAAVAHMSAEVLNVVAAAGLTLGDIKLVVPHQANDRILNGIAKRLHVPNELIFSNVANSGNTSAASIPLALEVALNEGRINRGDYIVIVGLGGGMTWGAALIRWA